MLERERQVRRMSGGRKEKLRMDSIREREKKKMKG